MVYSFLLDPLNRRLLQSLQEVSVEQSGDGLNGESVGYYREGNDEYTVKVKLVNGKKEGEAEVLTQHHNGV